MFGNCEHILYEGTAAVPSCITYPLLAAVISTRPLRGVVAPKTIRYRIHATSLKHCADWEAVAR